MQKCFLVQTEEDHGLKKNKEKLSLYSTYGYYFGEIRVDPQDKKSHLYFRNWFAKIERWR